MNDYNDKVFVVCKASGPTSFDVVKLLRRVTGLRKIGHTGTLDPLARGVLILCTGSATRAVEHFMDLEKEYEFEVALGVETSTLDAEGEVVREAPVPDLDQEQVVRAAQGFVGPYSLSPPRFSAVKRDGRRMYERARAGEVVEVPEKLVHIYAFEIVDVELPRVRCRVRCSRGTYVRSLARDLGARLGLPAHITALARTRIGTFKSEGAYPSERLEEGDAGGLVGLPLAEALSFLPGVVLTRRSTRALLDGTRPRAQDVVKTVGPPDRGDPLRILDDGGGLVAVGTRNEGAARNRLYLVDSYRLFASGLQRRG